MANKVVNLYIDDTSLRLMTVEGKRIIKWANLSLESGLVRGGVIAGEAEVAAKIRQLCMAQKIKTKKINIGVSGLHCLTRPIVLPQLPSDMLNEAVMREARSMLPVPPEQLYISWQVIPGPEDKTHVFLVAIPNEMTDVLIRVLHQAGLDPRFMDIKPLLLTRVVKDATAIIVDVQKTDFDIVILVDGVPQPIRTIPFLDEGMSREEKLIMIRNELERTITFYDSNNPENPLDSSVSIFASGELADESELYQSLSDQLGHPVLSLPSPLEGVEGFAPNYYMANIGLALESSPLLKEAGPSVARLNALPAKYRRKPVSRANIVVPVGAGIAAGFFTLLVVLTQSTSVDITALSAQLNRADQTLQQMLSTRQELVDKVTLLKNRISETETSRDNFTAALGSIERQGAAISNDLKETIMSRPNTVTLSSIGHAEGILTVSGQAPSEKDVLLYLEKLDTSGRFGELSITNMSRIEDGGMDFTLLGSIRTYSGGIGSMEAALESLPGSVSLTSVTSGDGTLTINGRATDENELLLYFQSLEVSGKFYDINIVSMTRIEGGEMDFSLVLTMGE